MEEFYHVLNRGVDKRKTFLSSGDYARFVHDLWEFNDTAPAFHNLSRSLLENNKRNGTSKMRDVGRLSFSKKEKERLVRVHFFCLMPNHYHLLLSPVVENGISLFMKKLNGGYAKYFNEKYAPRTGALWQGKYKSVLVETDRHFMYLPYYIHFNPLDLAYPEWRTQSIVSPKKAAEFLAGYRWSSHLDYLGEKNFPSVTDRRFFLEHFGGEKGYARSVANQLKDFSVDEVVGMTLE